MSKNKIIIIFVSILILLIVFLNVKDKKREKQNIQESNVENKENVQVLYDEETSLYYIKDEITNEIIYASQNEDDLDFYKENPDYNPNPLAPRSTELSDFLNYGLNYYDDSDINAIQY